MKYWLSIIALLTAALASAQEKGATPVFASPGATARVTPTTRAVVVGISDYQDNGIPDLQFADRDAEAFAAWLRSPAGGSVSERNLALLTNEMATMAQFDKALGGLIENAREGDQVIIYFSGHGDVETKTMRQSGFLLCYDSPAAAYTAGAYSLYFLKDVIETLSLQNKARVLVITDACHAGKLAGSSINGSQLTSQNLAKQFENESKILSCQPYEYSLEGAQWGGGRGLFSFHLVDGLTGLADRNGDGAISLFEIQQYLQSKVPEEAAPHQQIPMIVGDLQTLLAHVDAPALAALRQAKAGEALVLKGTGMKGWEDDLVAATDSTTQALYYAYKGALEHGAFLDTAAGYQSAWALLPQLLQRESLHELHGLLKRNLAAALQDEAQQALNALLDDDPYEANQWRYNAAKYSRYPEYLATSIELLGEQHYMYKTLMAKKLFFEAKRLGIEHSDLHTGTVINDSIGEKIRAMLKQGLQLEPEAPYLYYSIGDSYMNDMLRIDSFFYYHNQAILFSPTWLMPRLEVVNNYLFNHISSDWRTCEQYLLNALALKPDSYLLTERLAWLYQRMFRFDDAIQLMHRMTRMRPDLPNGFATLSTTYLHLRQYDLGVEYAQKAMTVDSTVLSWPMLNLHWAACATKHYEDAFKIYREAMSRELELQIVSPVLMFEAVNSVQLYDRYEQYIEAKFPGMMYSNKEIFKQMSKGRMLMRHKQFTEAKTFFLKSMGTRDTTVCPDFIEALSNLAQIAWQEGKPDSAEYYFQKSVNYYPELLASWTGRFMHSESRYHYARFLLTQNRPAEAEVQLKEAEQIDPRNPLNYYGMAALHAAQKHDTEALDWLAKALEWYYPDYDEIMAEPLFRKIRKTKRFKALMQQYFPDGSDRPKVEALARQYMPEVFGG